MASLLNHLKIPAQLYQLRRAADHHVNGSRLDDVVHLAIQESEISTWAGTASFFRNVQPQVFYANQLFNIMIRAVQWAVYGNIESPFQAPQVSNANLTAIVRLDADGSNNLEA